MSLSLVKVLMRTILIGYLLVLIVLPISAVYMKGFSEGWGAFLEDVQDGVAVKAVWLTIKLSAVTALIQAVVGTLVAYTLVRYTFPGKRILNSLVDLPFALPTAVSGVILLTMFSPNSVLGSALADVGIELLYNHYAIVIGMTFVTFPFVVRAIQPLLEQLDQAEEEASSILGAGRWMTFHKVVFPAILPGILSGSMLALSRALAEFGVIALISGNLPERTLVASVYIFAEIETFNPVGASVISIVLLTLSFLILWWAHFIQRRKERYA
ncbi:sulfate ABC transporter permease subunit CysT [Xylanibacillus composti]|uniref:Sulfate transport system permease protein CysT n=1 Tax=Xylanibacillus composti TaxID=1572762 RepID=A0A8J4M323_9BACL|nr:sulfate ABC transporter permease subunit CysT [Xylanibacillus composti]MDT9726976.1 sulfate ABC transporter permease subunit CysT [Xylanibacillus composti]GIQ69532.1 sulfate ABC transporter permease [Xylanibacillus composti]